MKESLVDKLSRSKNLTDTECSIVSFIVNNIEEAQKIGVRGIAKKSFTSTSSVIKVAYKLGYDSYSECIYDLKYNLYNEKKSNESLLNINISNIYECDPVSLAHIIALFTNKDTVSFVYGAGFSEAVAEYIYKKFLLFEQFSIYSSGGGSTAIFHKWLMKSDYLILVSKSGETESVLYKAGVAKEANIPIIAFTGNSRSSLANIADYSLIIMDQFILDDSHQAANPFFGFSIILFELLLNKQL